jgi:hypothetical protein
MILKSEPLSLGQPLGPLQFTSKAAEKN